jgi:hypothetical protein
VPEITLRAADIQVDLNYIPYKAMNGLQNGLPFKVPEINLRAADIQALSKT